MNRRIDTQFHLGHGPAQDFLRGGIQIEPQGREVKQTEGVVTLDDVQPVLAIQNRKCERALNLLSHVSQAVEVEGFFLLNKLYGYVTVGLDLCFRQAQSLAEGNVIMKHAVVSQSKHILSGHPQKGMIVVVALCASLGGHPGVSQNDPGLFRHPEAQAVGRNWALVDPQRPAHIVGNAGRKTR